MNRRETPVGYTLVELLVVIFIIGVLVAILLPAIQAAREAARRVQCKNNLKQLALAAITHHEQIGWFPTGGWSEEWVGDRDRGFGEEQPGGWAYNILPFLESQHLHDLPADGTAHEITDEQKEGARVLIESPIEIINCPSRREPIAHHLRWTVIGGSGEVVNSAPTEVAGKLDFAMNYGVTEDRFNRGFTPGETWRWNTTGFSTMDEDWNGISFPRSEVGIRHVSDGTSKTYLIGEKFLIPSAYGGGGYLGDVATWISGFARYGNGNRSGLLPPAQDEDTPSGNGRQFGSVHRSAFHMAYCDGSVRVVNYDIDLPVHQAASNRHDGLVFGE